MADPLSIAASVITVVGTANGVGELLSRIKSLQHAPDELLALVNEVSDLRVVFGDIASTFLRDEKRSPTLKEQLQHISDLVDRAKDRLLELEKLIHYHLVKPEATNLKVSRHAWAMARGTIERFRNNLRDVKLNLIAQMVIISSYVMNIHRLIQRWII